MQQNFYDYIKQLKEAKNGKEARLPIVNALNYMYRYGGNASTFNGHTSDYFATKDDFYKAFYGRPYHV